jgi:hypothetical protein
MRDFPVHSIPLVLRLVAAGVEAGRLLGKTFDVRSSLADREDQTERIRPSIAKTESTVMNSTKCEASPAGTAARAGKIPDHPARKSGVRRIVSEYRGENTVLPLGDHMRKSKNGQDSADIADKAVKPVGSRLY